MDFSVDCTNVKMVGQSITIYSVTVTLIHFIKAGRKKTHTSKNKQNKTKQKKKSGAANSRCLHRL